MTFTMVRRRYAWARRWRTCPACEGQGERFDWGAIARGAGIHSIACYLCGGGAEVRHNIRVSLLIALRAMTPLIRKNVMAELAARRRMRVA